MTKALKICIIGLKCYDHISGAKVPRYLGGIETQLTVLGKGLAKKGCEVSLITYDHGQGDEEIYEGVRVIKSHHSNTGLPVLRRLHPRSTRFWQAMRRADADIYLQMGAGYETGQTALGCRLVSRRRRRFVFCLASDANFGAHLSAGNFGMAGRAYRFGLKNADLIISQTARQREGLKEATGLASTVIPMAVIPPTQCRADREKKGRVLWLGRITPGKRLEWLLEAARRLPNIDFDVVGTPNRESPYSVRVAEQARQMGNVTVHGRISTEEVAHLYAKCRLLCCTSELEGFPTTFLEAWACGVPVVTTFDPDGVVAKNGLGCVVSKVDDLVVELETMLHDDAKHQLFSRAAHEYYACNHSEAGVVGRFCETFASFTEISDRACELMEVPS